MTIINIRGGSGSGKSTLVHRLLKESTYSPIELTLDNWKKPKIVGYIVKTPGYQKPTFVVGRYETQCGGCDSMSYKGSHQDIENLIRESLPHGNVVYEGLTISSTLSRWQRISDENPGQFVWAFMETSEEECLRRILARNGGKDPKRNEKGIADYQIKYRNCMHQRGNLLKLGERVVDLTSDDEGYQKLISLLE